ncbi:MAG: FKBP-type peptidyl-prolyl cis-trans isomerase [Rikenellaceae bacterium]|nr:FKBP-type peptidyl-prolyl cis-trans isomerase [Rikenellaceae bacterium]
MKLKSLLAMLAVAAMMTVVGCNDNDTKIESQRTTIERFLTSSHQPRLIAESDVPNSIEYNPPFYEKLSQDIYRYVATYYDEDRDLREEVEMGDMVELTFTAYIFNGSQPSLKMVYYTNEASIISSLSAEGLNTQYWVAEPLVLNLGESNIIKGVERSLLGCREGDKVEVYMTYEAAYDKDAVGVIEKETSVAWIYTIDKVVKR